MRYLVIFLLIVISYWLYPSSVHAQATHPFMIVRPDQYASLRTRADQEPWASMRVSAITECTERSFPPPCNSNLPESAIYPNLNTDTFCLRAIVSACTLAAVLDPTNKPAYVDKLIRTLPEWESVIIEQSGAGDGSRNWSGQYFADAAAAYTNSLLAIDILHAELENTPLNLTYPGVPPFVNQLAYAEFLMQQEFNHFYNGPNSWVYNLFLKDGTYKEYVAPPAKTAVREAVLILWKIYTGTFSPQDPESVTMLEGGQLGPADPYPLDGYLSELAARVNESGTYTEGSSYGYAAWGIDRDARSHLPDILEFTGKDTAFGIDYYTNPRYQAFYEWLYGYASTPFNMMVSFGDTYAFRYLSDIGHGGNNWTTSSHIGQAGKFSPVAGDYAAWKNRGDPQQGRLLNYLLYQPNLGSSRPTSRLFPNGGGFFISQPVTDNSLYGAMWNVKDPGEEVVFHVRKDVNAIYLAAYGVPLLMNGGFCGASSTSGPDNCYGRDENGIGARFSGNYLGHRAISNNVALVNYTVGNETDPDPDTWVSNFGSGVLEGFTSKTLDYVTASTRTPTGVNALTNGVHDRSFIMVQPTNGTNGYFVTFDEFSNLTDDPPQLAFHPNALSRQEITPLTEFLMPVGRRRASDDASVGLSLFFATPPSNIEFHRGIIASIGILESFIPQYFLNAYPTNPNHTKQIATIFFPYNATHTKPPLTRLSGNGYSGAQIAHHPSITDFVLETDASRLITQNGLTSQAKALIYRLTNNLLTQYFVRSGKSFTYQNSTYGFASDAPVSLYLDQTQGSIISPGTSVNFYAPGLTGLRLNGQVIASNPVANGRQAIIPSGTHTLELVTSSTPPPNYDFVDLLDRIRLFGQNNESLNLVGSYLIDIFDLNSIMRNL